MDAKTIAELARLQAVKILYQGTFTTDSITVPADTVCGGLYGNNYWDGCVLMPLAGACAWQPRKMVTFAGGGAFGVFYLNNPFSALPGLVPYVILEDAFDPIVGVNSIANVAAFHVIGNKEDTAITANDNVSSIMRYLKGILPQVIKSLGAAPVVGQVVGAPAQWQGGAGTSGEVGSDLITLGATGVRNKLHSLLVNISALTPGATITVKMFMMVNGAPATGRRVYRQNFVQGVDPNGLWIVNGTLGIHEALRVEVQSNNAADNGLAIDYDYMLEAM